MIGWRPTDYISQMNHIKKLQSALRDKSLNTEARRRIRIELSREIFEAGKPRKPIHIRPETQME